MSETENIKLRYEKRLKQGHVKGLYEDFVVLERENMYSKILIDHFSDVKELTFLEIGTGSGANLSFFKSTGILSNNIYANELLEDRVVQLKNNHPDIHVFSGNALDIPEENKFDIIFQSTVFTSILDLNFRKQLADKMKRLLKPGGIIIWYDFIYNNPKNKDVRKVSVDELKHLFSDLHFVLGKKITLAPPIGRKVGRMYSFFNWFSFLRSHYIAVFKK